jgi:hypothetical protein
MIIDRHRHLHILAGAAALAAGFAGTSYAASDTAPLHEATLVRPGTVDSIATARDSVFLAAEPANPIDDNVQPPVVPPQDPAVNPPQPPLIVPPAQFVPPGF